mmetsp:Transcript_26948/g.30048  ORF Transcript_26948/g.30048 Transcript_26948/m.30048 type:complete len:160 (+) Transcript_26948:331-810(+)
MLSTSTIPGEMDAASTLMLLSKKTQKVTPTWIPKKLPAAACLQFTIAKAHPVQCPKPNNAQETFWIRTDTPKRSSPCHKRRSNHKRQKLQLQHFLPLVAAKMNMNLQPRAPIHVSNTRRRMSTIRFSTPAMRKGSKLAPICSITRDKRRVVYQHIVATQ